MPGPDVQGSTPLRAIGTTGGGPGWRRGRDLARWAHRAARPAINVAGSPLIHRIFSSGRVCSGFPNETHLHVKRAQKYFSSFQSYFNVLQGTLLFWRINSTNVLDTHHERNPYFKNSYQSMT